MGVTSAQSREVLKEANRSAQSGSIKEPCAPSIFKNSCQKTFLPENWFN